MSDKPRIYANCKAGCLWETVHKSDFEKSASFVEQYPQEDGSYLLKIGKEYKIFAPKTADGTAFNCVLNANEGSDYEAVFETPCNDDFADSFTFKPIGFKWDDDGVCYFYYEYSGIRYSAIMGIDYETFSACKVSGATRVLLYNANATITAENGKSAYEIAVEKGFEGTEEEWIASITQGEDGATFIPSVSEDGTLSWTNDKGLENPDPVNIKGADGTGVYISEITESATDGGENIIRFSDNTYLSVRNGNRGRDGENYVLTEADKSEIAEQAVELIDGVPSYWLSALQEGAEAINTALCTAGRNKSAFLFYSDSHWNYGSQKSPILLKYLYKHTGLTKTIFGGDIVNDEATDYDTMAYLWEWRNMLKDLPNHHSVVGNHDDGNSTNNLFSEQYVYGYLLSAEETPDIVRGEGMYYYIDHSPEKTRYLYLDTAYKGLDDTQKEFIKQALISTPSGWHIVVISHIWYMPDYDQYDQRPVPLTGLSTDATTLTAMLDAYNSRTGDYVDCDGWVEFCIGGHIHYDYDGTTETGIPIILVETDSNHTRGNYTYTAGTTTEASVNGIIADYDNHKIYIVRIGRGESREVEITNYVVNYTNVLPLALAADGTSIYNGIGYKADTRWSESGQSESTSTGDYLTGYIPVSKGDTIYCKNIDLQFSTDSSKGKLLKVSTLGTSAGSSSGEALNEYNSATWHADGTIASFVLGGDHPYIRIQSKGITEASIITINEPIE